MPLPMVHLAIAVQLYQEQEQPFSPEFLLGSLAPDAIHMRDGWTREGKKTTHFGLPDDFPDWTQIEPILAEAGDASPPRPAFTAGYIAHILTDNHWIDSVVLPTRPRIPTELSPEERRTLYYQETDQVDFNLYRHAPWRHDVWEELAQAQALDFPPLLRADEIDKWRTRTLHWFRELKNEPKIVPVYYTDALVADFVKRATVVVKKELEKHDLYNLILP